MNINNYMNWTRTYKYVQMQTAFLKYWTSKTIHESDSLNTEM